MKTVHIINHNNKLHCNAFIDIAAAPSTPLSEGKFPIKVMVEEKVLAQSTGSLAMLQGEAEKPIAFEAEIISLLRFKSNELPSIVTYLSSGLCPEDFIKQYSTTTEDVAVYTYRKIKP